MQREHEIAREIKNRPRDERLRVWQERTGKSESLIYSRLALLHLIPEVAEALKRVKAREGIGESEQIRRGIGLWLKSRGVTVKVKTERKRASTRKRP